MQDVVVSTKLITRDLGKIAKLSRFRIRIKPVTISNCSILQFVELLTYANAAFSNFYTGGISFSCK